MSSVVLLNGDDAATNSSIVLPVKKKPTLKNIITMHHLHITTLDTALTTLSLVEL